MRRLAPGVLVALAIATPASAAALKSKSAHSGSVAATISWQGAQFMEAKHVRLRITRSGQVALDTTRFGLDLPQAIKARDLDANGEPEVIVDFYTGGAHCCSFSRLYRYTGSTYVSLRHLWGDMDYRLNDLDRDRMAEFVSADDRFAYVFTAYASSAFPIQIWDYGAGKMTDVTRHYPAQIRKDAASLWKGYLEQRASNYPDVRGILAAWLADEYLLGRQAQGWAKMRDLNRQGVFRGIAGDDIWAQGDAYLARLKKFLRKNGYSA